MLQYIYEMGPTRQRASPDEKARRSTRVICLEEIFLAPCFADVELSCAVGFFNLLLCNNKDSTWSRRWKGLRQIDEWSGGRDVDVHATRIVHHTILRCWSTTCMPTHHYMTRPGSEEILPITTVGLSNASKPHYLHGVCNGMEIN
jgi:hypothetical protein